MAISTNEKYVQAMKSNPKEICAVARPNQTFAIQNGLAKAGQGDDTNQPLKVYAVFSRFPICIIQDHKSVSANISMKELPAIFKKSDFCLNKELEMSLSFAEDEPGEPVSCAYTQVLTTGRETKGKTPAQVILESGNDPQKIENAKGILKNQYKWLREQVAANPNSKFAAGNKAQMQAIEEASKLYSEGKLTAKNAGSKRSLTIFASGVRPNVRKKRADGKSPVFEYSIAWNFGNKYPVALEIRNYFAPVVQKENGMLNVLAAQKVEEVCYTMNFSVEEWEHILYMMKANMEMFERDYASSAYRVAENQYFRNVEDAKGRQPTRE